MTTKKMLSDTIYKDIASRSDGNIYIGVVGPVRTGKSTFIKKFMEALVLPNIQSADSRSRAEDEMPQSASGKTVMTTEPKFVPEQAAEIVLDDNAAMKLKLIDCVGYIVPEAAGLTEEGSERMVQTPWSDQPMPFEKAAEMGTHKVISEHSTIGVVVTTDGSFGDIARENFVAAEERVINELKSLGKPFVIVLNTSEPKSDTAAALAEALTEKYSSPVVAVDCFGMREQEIREILKTVLYEFPVREVSVEMPGWVLRLPDGHKLKSELTEEISSAALKIRRVSDIAGAVAAINESSSDASAQINKTDLGTGRSSISLSLPEGLFYKVLGETCSLEINGEEELITIIDELSEIKQKYDRIAPALDEAERTGYGIVTPSIEDLNLEEPEIIKQPGGYGVCLKAKAPCLHLIKADVETSVSPIVGSERQSEDIIKYLLEEFAEDPKKLWDSNMFGKSLHELINEGLNTKLAHLPQEARLKFAETLGRIINEGSSGLICIIL